MSMAEKPIVEAEEMAKEFKEHSVAEFFKKNKQMLGLYGKVRTLTMVIHEYVTNSIDACEEANILPTIEVKIDDVGTEHYKIKVIDNGPGLTQATVGKAFGQLLAGTKFHRMMQARGQQGIGCAGCTMLSQMTTGKTTQVITGTGKGKPISLDISIDPKRNAPKITNLKELSKEFKGTAVQAHFKGVIYRESDQGPLEYLRRTAIANPHCQIKFRSPNGETTIFKRSQKSVPKPPKVVKPHPKGVSVDELITLAKYTKAQSVEGFLKKDFDRMGTKSLAEVRKRTRFDMRKDPKQLDWHEAEEVIKSFKAVDFIAPSVDGLRPIGEEQIEKSLNNIVEPEFIKVMTRKPQVYSGGFPFQIEVAITYGGNSGKSVQAREGMEKRMEIMRFANSAPLLFDQGNCAITKAVQSVDWKRYDIKDIDNAPVTVFVNFSSAHIPYTGAGKQAIADEEEVLEEIRLALMQTGRHAGRYIAGKRKEAEKLLKRELFFKYIPEIAKALNELTKEKEENLIKKLEKMVLDKLKLEEAEEQAEKTEYEKEAPAKDTAKAEEVAEVAE